MATKYYLVDSIQRKADTGRRQLRSSSMETPVVPYTRLVTTGDRAFSSFGIRLWNSLPNMLPLLRHCQLSDLV